MLSLRSGRKTGWPRRVTGRAIGDRPYGDTLSDNFPQTTIRRGDHWSPALLAEQSAGLTPSKQSHFFISSFLHFFIFPMIAPTKMHSNTRFPTRIAGIPQKLRFHHGNVNVPFPTKL